METTAPRIEILTIGVQGTICLLYIFHNEIVQYWPAIKPDIQTVLLLLAPVSFVFAAICYSIGAIVDGVTAILDGRIPYYLGNDSNYSGRTRVNHSPDTSTLELHHRDAYESTLNSDYNIRLLRSTGFNIALAALFSLRFGTPWVTCVAIGASVVVLYAWWRRRSLRARRTLRLLLSLGLVDAEYQPLNKVDRRR